MKCLLVIVLVAVASAAPTHHNEDGVKHEVTEMEEAAPIAAPTFHQTPLVYHAPISHPYYSPIAAYTGYSHSVISPVTKSFIQPIVKPFVPIVVHQTVLAEPKVYAAPVPVVVKAVAPVAFAAPIVHAPVRHVTYEYQPTVTKYVAKPYEVPIKKVEFVVEKTGCKNSFGNDVPCRKSKREAQEVIDTPVEIPVETPVVTPVVYNSPIAYNTPLAYNTPIAYNTPLAYNTPFAYNAWNATHVPTAISYKALPAKVQEIGVPQPIFKHYTEQIALKPACQNGLGMAVPCHDNF